MVHVVFIDGTEISFETVGRKSYEYMDKLEMFLVHQTTHDVMLPREFVKYIEVIEV